MGSKFENFDIGRAVASALNTRDPKNFPVELNTDVLQPVISFPLDIPDTLYDVNLTFNSSIGTLAEAAYALVGPGFNAAGNLSSSGNPPFEANTEYHVKSFYLQVGFDAAGATAKAGSILRATVALRVSSLAIGPRTVLLEGFSVIQTGVLTHNFQFPQGSNLVPQYAATPLLPIVSSGPGWNGYVPPNYYCDVHVECVGGSGAENLFPANANVSGGAIIGKIHKSRVWNGRGF